MTKVKLGSLPCSSYQGVFSYGSSIGHRHSRLSSFGTSNFLKKISVLARGYFIRYLHSSGLKDAFCSTFIVPQSSSVVFWFLITNLHFYDVIIF